MVIQQQQQSKKLKILVIGDSCEDIYYYGTCGRLSPEAPVPILNLSKTESKPGMCLNVAKNLEGLGLKVDVITHKESIKKHRYIEEKRLVHLLRMDEQEKIISIDVEIVKQHLKKNDYDAIVISDYDKGFLSHKSCTEIVSVVDKKIPIFVDSKKCDLSCFSDCIIKINKSEKESIKFLPKNYELIVTLGENGAEWKETHYPTIKSKLYDVCGAGDTFLAALTYKFLHSKSLDLAIKFANKCASISVTHFGNFILKESDI